MGRQEAKALLRGNWGQAVWVEGCAIGGEWLLQLVEWGLLLWCGLPVGQALVWPTDGDHAPFFLRLAILVGMVMLDWLVLSPVKLGRATLYCRILSSDYPVPTGHLRRCFRWKRYRRALLWRLHRWGRRLWWSLLLWTPAITLWSVGEQMRLASLRQSAYPLLPLLLLIGGTVLLVLGWLGVEVLMLRYLPVAYFIERGMPVKAAFRQSPRVMKGHMDSLLRFYGRHLLRLCSCVLVLPSLYVMPLFRMEQAGRVRLWAKMAAPIEKTAVLW